MHHVHSQVVGQNIVVGVTRLDDGAVHVDAAMATLLVIPEAVAAKHEVAGVADGLLGRARAGFQRNQRHEGLVGGARRVGATQGPVQKWLVGRFVQGLPVVRVNAFDKQVGIKRGFAHKRQNFAGFRLNRHQRTTPFAKKIFHHSLQLDVN